MEEGVESMSRTVVNLKDDLIRKGRRLTGLKKKVEIVTLALEELVRQKEARKILDLAGKVKGEWHIKEWRKGRFE